MNKTCRLRIRERVTQARFRESGLRSIRRYATELIVSQMVYVKVKSSIVFKIKILRMNTCKKCNTKFEPTKGLINYCSLQCRNSRVWNENDKKRKSEAALKSKGFDFSEEQIQSMIKLVEETKSLKSAAELLGIHAKTLSKHIDFVRTKESKYTYIKRWRKNVKSLLVEYKGGKCQIEDCGYNRCNTALEFHHLDPNEKDFGIGESGRTMAFEKMKKEVDKCILVCANCHREIHAGLIIIN